MLQVEGALNLKLMKRTLTHVDIYSPADVSDLQ
jgi:hypothetical protein